MVDAIVRTLYNNKKSSHYGTLATALTCRI